MESNITNSILLMEVYHPWILFINSSILQKIKKEPSLYTAKPALEEQELLLLVTP